MTLGLLARILGAILLGVIGYQTGVWLSRDLEQFRLALRAGGAVLGVVIGLVFTPFLTVTPFNIVRRRLASMAVGDLVVAGVGLVIGLVLSALLTIPLRALPGALGNFAPLVAAVGITYVAITILLMRHRELTEYVTERKFLSGAPRKGDVARHESYLLDTSAIIDGRIADVASTGFLSGTMLVPQFILRELQSIADSSDSLRRARGRRGLDVLARLQTDNHVRVEVMDISANGVADADSKLVVIAKENGYSIITNDFNLNKVAALQGVKILNLNELAQAVRPVLLPGEEISVRIVQEGKEFNQGVGYLDDGTMVVVENGRHSINSDVAVTVTRVLQTVAGRMIFAQLASENHTH